MDDAKHTSSLWVFEVGVHHARSEGRHRGEREAQKLAFRPAKIQSLLVGKGGLGLDSWCPFREIGATQGPTEKGIHPLFGQPKKPRAKCTIGYLIGMNGHVFTGLSLKKCLVA